MLVDLLLQESRWVWLLGSGWELLQQMRWDRLLGQGWVMVWRVRWVMRRVLRSELLQQMR